METHGEIDPSTEMRETKFHEEVRDILGIDPFARHEVIFAELRRLKQLERAAYDASDTMKAVSEQL
jgi:hypothetical protein